MDNSKIRWEFPPPKIIPRSEWCHHPRPTCGLPLNKNIKYVVVTLETPTFNCKDHEECLIALRKLYKYYVTERNLADIPFNFLVGQDGTIYEARGFNSQPSRSLKYHWQHHGNRIDIALIGDFSANIRSLESENSIWTVVHDGVKAGYIDMFYDILEYKDMEKVAEAIRLEKKDCPYENWQIQEMAHQLTKKRLDYDESLDVMKGLIPQKNWPVSNLCVIM